MAEMKPDQKRLMIIGGGVLVLYLLYRYYKGQQANSNANTAGAPADASAQYAALAGQEQSDVAALQAQEQSDVANLLGANTQLGSDLAAAMTAFEATIGAQQAAWMKAEAAAIKKALGATKHDRTKPDKGKDTLTKIVAPGYKPVGWTNKVAKSGLWNTSTKGGQDVRKQPKSHKPKPHKPKKVKH